MRNRAIFGIPCRRIWTHLDLRCCSQVPTPPLNPAYPNPSFPISPLNRKSLFHPTTPSLGTRSTALYNRLLFPGSPLCSIPRLTFLEFPTYILPDLFSGCQLQVFQKTQLDDAVFVGYTSYTIFDLSLIPFIDELGPPRKPTLGIFADHAYLDFPSLTATTAKSRFKIATKNNHYSWTCSNWFWTQLQMNLI